MRLKMFGAMHFIYQTNRLTTTSVAGLERMTTGSAAKRLILSRHKGRQLLEFFF